MDIAERLPATSERVEQNTAPSINEWNRQRAEASVARYTGASQGEITQRLRELDHEWDIERVLEANASSVILLSVVLGFTTSRKWFFLTGVAAGFLLQHSLQGWCPPVVPWRRAGVRTTSEIEEERMALKTLRGDFQPTQDAAQALMQARRD